MKKPIVLIVMDGWGLNDQQSGNAVHLANTPNFKRLKKAYPYQTLKASGMAVGLPEGQMGNSEVGHLNLGAGRVVYQSLTRIHQAIEDETFFKNETYLKALEHVKDKDSALHVMGLLSDGGVHSHISHFQAVLKMAKKANVNKVYVHAFLDGRDVPPRSALDYIKTLENTMEALDYGHLSSVSGRYYAMDRDNNYDRIRLAYHALVHREAPAYETAEAGVKASYEQDIDDEFVKPFIVSNGGQIQDNDAVIFMNFRPDRAIQLSTALTVPKRLPLDDLKQFNQLYFVQTMHYADWIEGEIAFSLQTLESLFGDVIQASGKKQLRIAETEKYAHVTFFFDGGKDKEIEGSTRILVDSPKVATYDLKPEMSAYEVTDKVLEALEEEIFDTIILNYANCDMVGHTGVIEAAVKAVETTDTCVGKVVDKILEKGGVALITADHGNAEQMLGKLGGVHTAHTTNDVPLIITDSSIKIRKGGILGDIAPTMLEYLKISQPKEMTGQSLILKK